MKAYLKWIVLITWSFTMTSCIKENLPECIPDNTGIVLKFRYPTGTNTQSNKKMGLIGYLYSFLMTKVFSFHK